jgi:DNA repair exonuclease SbcCD ATPase subunit
MVKHIQELEERIEKLEEFHSSWKKMPKWDLKDFIELVNSHEEQIKQISDWMLDKQDKIKYLEQKNEKLEYFKREYFDQFNRTYSWIREIEKIALESVSDIKKLESVLDVKKMEQIICDGAKLHAEVLRLSDKLANSTLSKKPYKCPVCEGAGMNTTKLVVENINGPNIVGMKHPECISCEGKGIVWSQ